MAEHTYGFKFLAPASAGLREEIRPDEPSSYARQLTALQQLRAREYLRDGAIHNTEIDHRGRFRMDADEQCWHFLLLNAQQEVIGCARYLLHSPNVSFQDLRIAQSPLATSVDWQEALRRAIGHELQFAREQGLGYAELGGWAIANEYHHTRAAAETVLASYLWAAMVVGHCVCSCTATVRNDSSSILRRIGGTPVMDHGTPLPSYFDTRYGCQIEIIRFDSRQLPQKFGKLIEQMRPKVSRAGIVRINSAEEIKVLDMQDESSSRDLHALSSALNHMGVARPVGNDLIRTNGVSRSSKLSPIFT